MAVNSWPLPPFPVRALKPNSCQTLYLKREEEMEKRVGERERESKRMRERE